MQEVDSDQNRISICLQLVETDAARESALKEVAYLNRKSQELEDEMSLKERDFNAALEESVAAEKKMEEKAR